MSTLNIVMAQINPVVGDIAGNTQKVIDSVKASEQMHNADLVVFPELTLCGYPPEDLLLRCSMQERIASSLELLQQAQLDAMVIVGYPKVIEGRQYNMAGVLQKGQWIAEYAKQELPNYQVFDEKRYFTPGKDACVFDLYGIPVALTICEDIWHQAPMLQASAAGAKLMININASPFHQHKFQERIDLLSLRAKEGDMPILYVNQVGGQDELVFDGASFAVQKNGEHCLQAPFYDEGLFLVELVVDADDISFTPQVLPQHSGIPNIVYDALVLGVRDYVRKNGFKRAVLGLSGGIDSALTLAIAVDALGADAVSAVMMPFKYTSELSQTYAADQAQRQGVDYREISIEPMYAAFMSGLTKSFEGRPEDLAEQNLQARCRGVLLMALSNKLGSIVLTTGNKSEMAVGYSTLYGDMAGGFDVLKDVPKTLVFELARFRNTLLKSDGSLDDVIPTSVIERPPSAELAPDQKDEDNLPPYFILDQILELYIAQDASADAIIAEGYDSDIVHKVIRLVDINEYKRRQAPIGIRISQRGFGRDRRYPVTNGWKPGV
jgi:NAD+ synthase (glutamine-hydrolysing)